MMNGLHKRQTFQSLVNTIEEDEDKLKYPNRKAKRFYDSFVFTQISHSLQKNAAATQAMEKALTKIIADKHGLDEGELSEAFRAYNLRPRFKNMGVGTEAPTHHSTLFYDISDESLIPSPIKQEDDLELDLRATTRELSRLSRNVRGSSSQGPIDAEEQGGVSQWFKDIFKKPYKQSEGIEIEYTPKAKNRPAEIDDLPTEYAEREKEFMEETERKKERKERG